MDQLVNFIIRPPRADYSPKDDLLDEEFVLKGRWFQRKDLEVINERGNKLKCSHYLPLEVPEGQTLPCVIYCHGNSGCRADASEAAIILLPSNITVFALDFSGSGLSEGEYVTLGWNEKDDLKAVVNHLRTDGSVSCIGLWGRSMGSVTSLMYGAEDPSIAGMVLDSPFSNLVDLMLELVDTYKYPLPKFTVKLAIQHMRKVIKKRANFDIMDLDTIQVAKCCFVPVLFGHATDDDFIRPQHSDRIYDSYSGDKNIIKFDGDHNSLRPDFYFDSITIFFHNVLNPPEAFSGAKYAVYDLIDGVRWTPPLHENAHGIPDPSVATDQENDLSQLRLRRPMSRTEVPYDISSQGQEFVAKLQENEGECNQNTSLSVKNDNNSSCDWSSFPAPIITDDEHAGRHEFSCTLSDMPCSIEDEERMLIEAIMESLRPLNCGAPASEGNSTVGTCAGTEGADTRINGLCAVGNSSYVDTEDLRGFNSSLGLAGSCSDCSSGKDCTSTDPKSDSMSNSSNGSSRKDTDISDGTRARLVVEKGPDSHIADRLNSRWGFNFFRNRS